MSVKKVHLYFLYVLVTTIVVLVIGNALLYKPELDIIKNAGHLKLHNFDDRKHGGNTVSSFQVEPEKLVFSYTKKAGAEEQYAGLAIEHKDMSNFSFEDYFVHIKGTLKGVNQTVFRLAVLGEKGVKLNTKQHLIFNDKIIYQKDGIIDETFHVSDLQVPVWWLDDYSDLKSSVPNQSFNNTQSLTIVDAPVELNGIEAVVTLTDFKLIPNYFNLKLFNGIVLFVFILLVVQLYVLKITSKQVVRVVTAPFVHAKVSTSNTEDSIDKITLYLSEHYKDCTLSLSGMGKDLGLSQRKISEMIKQKYEMSFKQYLNNLRITEAKHLLSTTENQVKEISYAVGYENQQHFMRVFKRSEGVTPSAYREHQISKI